MVIVGDSDGISSEAEADDDGLEEGTAVVLRSPQSGLLHASVVKHSHCPPVQSHSRELNVSPQHVSVPIAQVDPSSEHLPPEMD